MTIALTLLARLACAQTPELLITLGSLSVSDGITGQALALKNNSRKLIGVVWIECGSLAENGTLLSEGLASVSNLRPGDMAHFSAKSPHGEGATRTICKVSSVRY